MPEQTTMIEPARTPVREMRAGKFVDAVLLVREREVNQKRDGSDWYQLKVSDRTGETAVKVWSDSPGYKAASEGQFQPGQAVRVRGRYLVDERYGAEVQLKGDGAGIRPALDDEVDMDALLDGPARPVERLEEDFDTLVGTLGEPGDPVRDLVVGTLHACWEEFRAAPAAREHHQPYRHGLLEHTLNVAQTAAAIAAVYPDADARIAVAGALLHDVGKVDVYTLDPLRRDMTDAGRLYGEIPQSYYRVRRQVERLHPDGPVPAEVMAVLHVVASHHGRMEWGAAAPPCTREAFIVHFADMIDSRIGGLERIERRAQPGEEWSGYDRGIGARAWLSTSTSRRETA